MREATAKKIISMGFPSPGDTKHDFTASSNLFSALFLSRAPLALEGIRKIFQEYGVQLHRAQTAAEVDQWVRGRRLDLILCDYDAPGAAQLACLQPDTRWRGISMVIVGAQQTRDIKGKRVHFTVGKPFSPDLLAKGLRASYTAMARQRCAAFRHALALKPMAGTIEYRGFQRALSHSSITNLSQTGLCLTAPEPLPQGGVVSVNFALPGSDEMLHAIGTIIWSDASGKSGVRFNRISSQQKRKLQESLKSRLPWNVDSLLPSE